MNLSSDTIVILKNFASINQSIFVREGNKLKTMSVMKNVLAEAIVKEKFTKDFAIYDLNQFLNGISLHDNPELDFSNDSYLTIREGKRRVKYFFADPSVIVSPPEKEIDVPSNDIEFQLDHSQLEKLLKASSIYQLPDLAAVGENGIISLVVRDKKNDTTNEFSIIVGETNEEFTMNFKVENIKIVPGSYDVVISNKLISKFESKARDLRYWIALEPDSTFGN
jgi:hypothetical protein